MAAVRAALAVSRSRLRALSNVVFAGDRRVWRVALGVAVPLVTLILAWCLVPRAYFTGTNSVEDLTYIHETPRGHALCVPNLMVPADTARLQLRLISRTRTRPVLHMTLHIDDRVSGSHLDPVSVGASRISTATFPIQIRPAEPLAARASICLKADDLVNWGGTPTVEAMDRPPTVDGHPLRNARVAVWYLPRAGAKRSYASAVGDMFERASLFRPGIVGPWTYVVLFFALLPVLAVTAVRCLAQAVAGNTRGLAAWLFAVAALNACCWALITPAFHGPDEVDHFAYVQSLAERGQAPSRNPESGRQRWSSSEALALDGIRMPTSHQVGDSRAPWLKTDERAYDRKAALAPSRGDGGGHETAATHGPLYYLALAPGYLAGSGGSVWSQLTLARLISALIGALTVVFTFLLARELAPGRAWLAVVAALLVAFEPMYGFVSGIVNNDVGVNAGAAALELLLIRMLRRGIDWRWGALTGLLLVAIPIVKGTAFSLYPVAAIAVAAAIWRFQSRRALAGWGALVFAALALRELSVHLAGVLEPSSGVNPGPGTTANGVAGAVLHHPFSALSYMWQAVLPKLPFMSPHFPSGDYPGFVIFVKRGFGAFGWYDVFYSPWTYSVILVVMLAVPLLALRAARQEWPWVRHHGIETGVMALMPLAVTAGFLAAFYYPGVRPAIAEFGRYAFPAIAPLAVLVVGALHGFGRRLVLPISTGLVICMIALSYAGQLVTLTGFYA